MVHSTRVSIYVRLILLHLISFPTCKSIIEHSQGGISHQRPTPPDSIYRTLIMETFTEIVIGWNWHHMILESGGGLPHLFLVKILLSFYRCSELHSVFPSPLQFAWLAVVRIKKLLFRATVSWGIKNALCTRSIFQPTWWSSTTKQSLGFSSPSHESYAS